MRPLVFVAGLVVGCGGVDDVAPADSGSTAEDTAITSADTSTEAAVDATSSEASEDTLADTAPVKTPKERVLDFLTSISGKQTLAGIHNRHNAQPSQFTAQMHDITGKYPAFWSADFLFESEDIAHRADIVAQAKTEWSHGAVVQLMFHACPPDIGEPCDWDPGLMHHPLSDAAWKDLVTDGGSLNKAWKARLDVIAPYLKELQDAGVAPLFRPHHEMNQGAFWWGGRTGPEGTRKLYQITHDYLVKTKGIDQLVWVWDVQDLSWNFADYDPGEAYYDLAALDVYDGSGFTKEKYDAMVKVSHKPIAIGECQSLPSVSQLAAQPGWTFFMGWSELVAENNSSDALRALFDSPRVLTLDEMPGW